MSNAKTFLILALAAAVILSILAPLIASQSETTETETRPPGIPGESWVSLSDDAGILILGSNGRGIDGRLIARVNGRWVLVDLIGAPRLRPAP